MKIIKTYESIFITPPDLDGPAVEALVGKMTGLIQSGGGEVIGVDDWGVKRLAYEVEDHMDGHYVFMKIKCLPNTLEEINREYHLDNQVIRSMTVLEKPFRKRSGTVKPAAEEASDGQSE